MNTESGETTDLDVIASLLTPDVLRPFDVPRRPFLLGPRARFCIRLGYVSRSAADIASDAVPAAMPVSVGVVVDRLVASFGADRVDTLIGVLARHPQPDVLLSTIAASLGDARVLVVATPVRALTMAGDHPGPPTDVTSLREWTFPELQAFLDAEGLDVVFGGIAVREPEESGGDVSLMIVVGGSASRPGHAP